MHAALRIVDREAAPKMSSILQGNHVGYEQVSNVLRYKTEIDFSFLHESRAIRY